MAWYSTHFNASGGNEYSFYKHVVDNSHSYAKQVINYSIYITCTTKS
jgi:hypothetical protein